MKTLPQPIYQSDRVTLYCGDCLEIMPLLRGVDAIVSDPPYGIGFSYNGGGQSVQVSRKHCRNANKPIIGDAAPFDPKPILDQFYSNTRKQNVPIALFGADNYAQRLPVGAWYTWDKSCGRGPASCFIDSEIIWSNRKNARRIFRFLWLGVLREGEGASSKEVKLHVSQKPVELMAWIIETIRIGINKTVLDPYMGSGSTGVACLRTGRKFIGIEIDPEHAATAAERIRKIEAELLIPNP